MINLCIYLLFLFYTGYRIGVYAVLTICLVGVVSSLRTGCSARVCLCRVSITMSIIVYLTFFLNWFLIIGSVLVFIEIFGSMLTLRGHR